MKTYHTGPVSKAFPVEPSATASPSAQGEARSRGVASARVAVATVSPRGKLHSRLVREYVAKRPGTETKGFAALLRRIVARHRRTLDANLDEWSLEPIGFMPDAFRFARGRLTLVEAQDTNVIAPLKWLAIFDLFWLFDAAELDLELHVIDRNGSVFRVDLASLAFRNLTGALPNNADLPGALLAEGAS